MPSLARTSLFKHKCFVGRLRTTEICSLCQVNCYRELFRVLKPGGCFAGYEWCMTASFDADNPEHRRIKVRKHLQNWPLVGTKQRRGLVAQPVFHLPCPGQEHGAP
jgi:hypothetical protein